jgi:hypothetical protein
MSGHCLFNLYSRSRWSDALKIEELIIDVPNDNNGFIEGRTYETKTSNTAEKRRMFLPLTAVTDGVYDNQWYKHWLQARELCGMREPSADYPFIPTINTDGSFGRVPLSSSLASQWLRDLLVLSGEDKHKVSKISSHSLKATCLSWVAKAGISREHRSILGYHAIQNASSVLHYSRDEQAEPLRQLSIVLKNIRLGIFNPDSSRSGYFKQQSTYMLPTPKSKPVHNQIAVEPNNEDDPVVSDSSSSVARTRSEDLSDEERVVELNKDLDNHPKKRKGSGTADGFYALHSRWRTLHVVNSSDSDKLSCGRHITVLYKRLPQIPALECFRCRICFGQDPS